MINKWFLLLPSLLMVTNEVKAEKKPNIIFILADDMGYGDVSALNPNAKIKTPHLDRMISNGVSFTDAHTSSSVSTPTRYGVLTGRYNWRSKLKQGVLGGYSKALIPENRSTIASMLKKSNYTTGCVGKWHLGWDWQFTEEGTNLDDFSTHNKGKVDFEKPIKCGPTTLGFDYFYGFSGSLDMPPYVYVENEIVTAQPNRETEAKGMKFWRKGPTGSDFIHEKALPHLTDKAISFIQKEGKKNNPFFLYLPFPAPHTPILPTKEWFGKSNLNVYGDFVMMVDNEVGRIMKILSQMGIEENTLVVFTSDNGCSPQAKINDLEKKGHFPSYIYRGHKADLFEGGHRVPCIVQWTKQIKPAQSLETICLTDFFSTFAEIAEQSVKDTEGEDSFSLLNVLTAANKTKFSRKTTIHHSITGEFAIREGDWKLIVSPSSGGWSTPRPNDMKTLKDLPIMQLYNLKLDPGEKNNLYISENKKAKKLLVLLRQQISNGRSTIGKPQTNEVTGHWKQLEIIFKNHSL